MAAGGGARSGWKKVVTPWSPMPRQMKCDPRTSDLRPGSISVIEEVVLESDRPTRGVGLQQPKLVDAVARMQQGSKPW